MEPTIDHNRSDFHLLDGIFSNMRSSNGDSQLFIWLFCLQLVSTMSRPCWWFVLKKKTSLEQIDQRLSDFCAISKRGARERHNYGLWNPFQFTRCRANELKLLNNLRWLLNLIGSFATSRDVFGRVLFGFLLQPQKVLRQSVPKSKTYWGPDFKSSS